MYDKTDQKEQKIYYYFIHKHKQTEQCEFHNEFLKIILKKILFYY